MHISSHTRTRDYAVCSKRQGRHEMENAEKPKNAERTESVGEGKEARSRDDQKVLPLQARNERGRAVRRVQAAHRIRALPPREVSVQGQQKVLFLLQDPLL